MHRILIPIDGSPFSRRAMEMGKDIAKVYGSKITLMNVVNPMTPNLTLEESIAFLKMMNAKSKRLLEESKKYFDDLTNEVELVSLEGDIASTIGEYADRHEFDFVIMGSQGLNAGRIRGVFIGSITNKVIHITHRPILVIK